MAKTDPRRIKDKAGWLLGINASLKSLFGTDTEVRIQYGGMEGEIEDAKKAVGRMSEEAEGLLQQLDDTPKDSLEVAFENMVKDL